MSHLKTDFEELVLRELRKFWGNYLTKFKWGEWGSQGAGARDFHPWLQAPHFMITEAKVSHWGMWVPKTREMHFSRHLVSNRSWNEVLEVLKHEMVHQFVSEVLHVENEDPHGPTFMGVCKKFGIDAAPRGIPGADKLTTTNHLIEKVRHLLTLAENKGATEGEKEAAATAAHNMMLKYNIELSEKQEETGYTTRYISGITGRIQGYMSHLSVVLSKYYFVEVIWMTARDPRTDKKGHELEISGTEANVEVAEYVYDFLSRSALEAWEQKYADPVFKLQLENEFVDAFRRGTFTSPRGYNASARSNFLEGFIQGFRSQLQTVADQERQAGMVLAKDIGLEEFYHVRHPSIRSILRGGGKNNSVMRWAGYAQGQALKIPTPTKHTANVPLLGK